MDREGDGVGIPRSSGDRRSRGRPQRLPHDASLIAGDVYEGNKRLAWLLATTRLLGPQTRGLSRAEFVAPMKELGVRIDSSRISRWESGLEYISPQLVEAYEKVAGLRPAQIGAVRRTLARDGHLITRPAERAGATSDPGVIDELLDGLESQRIRGDQWIRLSDQLRSYQSVYLQRRIWQDLTDHLVDELARTASIPYLARYEAAAALMNAPQAQPYLTKSVGRYVLDPETRVITPVLQVLTEIADPAASDLVLRLMTAPSAKLRSSAAIAASAMIRRGNLAPDHKILEVHVGHELVRGGRPSVVVLDLASRLTDDQFERVLRSATDDVTRTTLRQARSNWELVDSEQARIFSDHIGLHAELLCARNSADPDQMLSRLVREALFHVHRSRRHLASSLILASPYATAVGEVVLRLTNHADDRLASLCWSMVARMTAAISATALAERLDEEARPELRTRAAAALMWVGGDLPDSAVRTLVSTVEDHETAPDAARAAILALGLADRRDELNQLLVKCPDDLRRLIQWSCERGPAVAED